MQVNYKINTYIGFAIKSSSVVFGADSVLAYKKRLYLVVISNEINETSQKKVSKKCEQNDIPLMVLETTQIEDAVKRKNCKCLALTNKNLADAIIKEINQING